MRENALVRQRDNLVNHGASAWTFVVVPSLMLEEQRGRPTVYDNETQLNGTASHNLRYS